MSLLLSHLKSYDTKTSDNSRSVQNTRAAGTLANVARSSEGKEFVKGEILKGEVIDLRNQQATIRLSDGSIVQGKMDQEVDLYIGQNATFEVAKSSESGIQLKIIPDQPNGSSPNDSLIQKALSQAGLPLSDKNKDAVGTLLDANLSVDKQSIQQFLKVMHQFPQADVKALVFLQKHNLPVNEANLSMLQEYQSSEHRVMAQLQTLTNGLTELFQNGLEEPMGMKLLQLALEPQNYVGEGNAASENANDMKLDPNAAGQTPNPILDQPAGLVPAMQSQPATAEKQEVLEPGVSQQGERVNANEGTEQLTANKAENQVLSEHAQIEDAKTQVSQELSLQNEQHPISEQPLNHHFTPIQLAKLGNDLEALQFPKQMIRQVKAGTITGHELLKEVYELSENHLNQTGKAGILKESMKNEVLQKIFQEELLHKFTMSPKQLSNGENVKKFYAKLERNLEEMNQLLQNSAKGEEASRLSGQTQHLKNNLNFMKTLNQIYPYIQLPVRLKDQNIHSELYVFTKRKGKLTDQDVIRLLLHLDMDHIGPLDIHLQMSKKNLLAKFYVESMEVQHLFENTIEELGTVLQEKGYHLSPEFYQQEKKSNPLEEMVLQEQAAEGMTMKRFTFDMRA